MATENTPGTEAPEMEAAQPEAPAVETPASELDGGTSFLARARGAVAGVVENVVEAAENAAEKVAEATLDIAATAAEKVADAVTDTVERVTGNDEAAPDDASAPEAEAADAEATEAEAAAPTADTAPPAAEPAPADVAPAEAEAAPTEAAPEAVAPPAAEADEAPAAEAAPASETADAATAEPVAAEPARAEFTPEAAETPRGPSGGPSGGDGAAVGRPLGYTGGGLGRTVTLAELEGIEKQRVADARGVSDDDLRSLYEDSMSDVSEGEIVSGRVVSITDKEIVVDFGFKSDGSVAKNEFDRELVVGEEIDVYLERLEDRRGQPMISKLKADDMRRWQRIEGAFEEGTVIEGEIVRRIKGGMIVNLLGSEAFLPGSQVDVRPVRDFDVYLGKTMEFKVVKINPQNGNVVVSHKALIEKDLQAQRQLILDSLEVGQVLEGQVKNIVNFGAFVDLGGVDGLLHITDLSWGRVGHPSEVLEIDQKLNIVVLDYDRERQRISLGYKQLLPHPWTVVQEKYAEGMEVEGRVVSITDYGAFVELEKGIEGLVHISEMSWTEHVKHPTQKVQLGQSVQVKILRIDDGDKKISLGMKQLEPDPWSDILARFPLGTVMTGKVRNLTTFGAFVEIEAGVDGLVHVSDLSWTKRVKHPSEVVRKGQELNVIVLDIDVANRRISLGHKQVETDPWQQYETAYPQGTEVTANVLDVNEGGVVVELPLEAEGFVPQGQLSRPGRPTDVYQIGETLNLSVLRLDREERVVVLSETAKKQAAERAQQASERGEKVKVKTEERRDLDRFQQAQAQQSGPATLGELSGLAALRDQLRAGEARGPEPEAAAPTAVPPVTEEPPVTTPGASSDLEGAVGTDNRKRPGKRKAAAGASADDPTGPAAESDQRREDAGDQMPAEMSQATLKGAGDAAEAEPGALAAQVEDATDDVLPTTDSVAGSPNIGTDPVPEEMSHPANAPTDADDATDELGGASLAIEGDLDAARAEATTGDEPADEKEQV